MRDESLPTPNENYWHTTQRPAKTNLDKNKGGNKIHMKGYKSNEFKLRRVYPYNLSFFNPHTLSYCRYCLLVKKCHLGKLFFEINEKHNWLIKTHFTIFHSSHNLSRTYTTFCSVRGSVDCLIFWLYFPLNFTHHSHTHTHTHTQREILITF